MAFFFRLIVCFALVVMLAPTILSFSLSPRGLATRSPSQTCADARTATQQSLFPTPTADYTQAAKVLFSNIIGPAALLTGGLVPFGFLSAPLSTQNQPGKRRARAVFQTLAVTSVLNEVLAIIYATVASNSLTRVTHQPATSVFALVQRDYELAWVATNVHFFLGLFGFGGMVMTFALCSYPKSLASSTCGLAASALLGMASIVNVGVVQGDGQGRRLGDNILSLAIRYMVLSFRSFVKQKTVLGMLSFGMFVVFGYQTLRNILYPAEQEDT